MKTQRRPHSLTNGKPEQPVVERLERALVQYAQQVEALTAKLQTQAETQYDLEVALQRLGKSLGIHGVAPVELSEYEQLVWRIRRVVLKSLPESAIVAVLSKGDPELLKLAGRTGWHFPRSADGTYLGYYPACSTSAIAQLEALRAEGAQYLLIPRPAAWWLQHYGAWREHLDERYPVVVNADDTCVIYALQEVLRKPATISGQLRKIFSEVADRAERQPAILDWNSGLPLTELFKEETIFQPLATNTELPYVDRSVDVVVTRSEDPARAEEARRVASLALITTRAGAVGQDPKLDLEWLPDSRITSLPSSSIIIPCYNGRALVNACLRALTETIPVDSPVEIILVDDASTDGTAAGLKEWVARDGRVKLLRNRRNLGFLGTANRGAQAASGEILIFLNNDTVPLPGWHSQLLRTFRLFPEAGVVGGKLIFPDGTLQEAGGLVFADGSAANFGRTDPNVDRSEFNFVREVDYCSGALFATPRALFEELGRFDRKYEPGYYEDTDYCFRVREAGRRVYYQPRSAVVHREGGTAGTDLAVGMKRYQVVNATTFKNRWRTALQSHGPRPMKFDESTWQTLAFRHYTPEGRTHD